MCWSAGDSVAVDRQRPNLTGIDSWSEDFSYGYLTRLLETARDHYEVLPVSEAAQADRPGVLALRHDVDVSVERALPVAEIEADLSLRATYMVMTRSPFYRVESGDIARALRQVLGMGHELGLHFDPRSEDGSRASGRPLEEALAEARAELEQATGAPVRTVSFHRPGPPYADDPLRVAGMVDACIPHLVSGYVSDSAGRWREGEAIRRVLDPDRPVTQLLIHPIWWAADHAPASERLQRFFDERGAGLAPDERKTLDHLLATHLPSVTRRGLEHDPLRMPS